MKKVVIALGGNALQARGEAATSENELKNVLVTARHIAEIIDEGYQVIISHGNGPQVGRILLQNEAGKNITPPMPMDVCGAMTQGMIGYHIQQGLSQVLREKGIDKPVVTVVTQVEVSSEDPAFQNPSKPVGAFYTEEEARQIQQEKGYTMMKDANRGYRRVVPSPKPLKIIEIDTVRRLSDEGKVVVAAGGGGIPVCREAGKYVGIEAVIDKDFASEVLAEQLDADVLLILTEVENVCLNFGKANQQILSHVTTAELDKYAAEGHFAPGSMLPKVQAASKFVHSKPGRIAVITSLENAVNGINGVKGTIVEG
ncbi:MAG: carbamate kinase [Oscillospiraceae bacterium]|nr:carbamate kinase [Oscillospiraceae bacterium]